MAEALQFLRELHDNNNREWFIQNKSRYLDIKNGFDRFALDLAEGIRGFDDSIGELTVKDMTWRIYRDVRFSKDKSPYKCHLGVFIAPGGKKSGYSGYYFHISAADPGSWENGHVAAIGDYMMDPKVIKILREDILYGGGDFRRILSGVDSRMKIDFTSALKKVPAGYPVGTPDSDFFRLKSFSLSFVPDDDFVLKPDLVGRLCEIFSTAKPFLDYVNRAIRFNKEEGN